jgi:hypothetical protein
MSTAVMLPPIWADAKTAARLFCLSRHQLLKLSKEGKIRSRKLGDSKQADRLYKVADIEEFLLAGGEVE